MKNSLFALAAAALALGTAGPALALSNPEDAIVASPARVISAGGLVYAPVYLGAGRREVGVALGTVNPLEQAGMPARQLVPLAGVGWGLQDGLDFAVLLSAESQIGLRQRYASGAGWSIGGSYIGRANVDLKNQTDFGGSYKLAGLWRSGGLELTAQPEVSYFQRGGAQAGFAVGADLWLNDRLSLGANGLYRQNFPSNAMDRRFGAGAKYLFNPKTYLWVNYTRAIEGMVDVGLVGLGHLY